MRKFLFAAALAVAVSAYAPTVADAGGRCRQSAPACESADAPRGPVRRFVANVVERWKARTERATRFACHVAAKVQPVVTVSFAGTKPTLGFSYNLVPVAASCVNGNCPK